MKRSYEHAIVEADDAADYEFKKRAALLMTLNIDILKIFAGPYSLVTQETNGFIVLQAMVKSIPSCVLSHCADYLNKTPEVCKAWNSATGAPALPLLLYLVNAVEPEIQSKGHSPSKMKKEQITKEDEMVHLLCDNFEKSAFETNLRNDLALCHDDVSAASVPSRLEFPSNLFKEQLNALAGKQDDLTKLEILRLISRFN